MFHNKLFPIFILLMIEMGSSRKLFLTVFYEAKSPNSKNFIIHQLKPAMELLHDHVELSLVPFGKSTSVENGFGGFDCEHGPEECLGNMVQDCVLDILRPLSDLDKLDYVTCEMMAEAGCRGSLECVQKANITTKQLIECVRYEKGTQLQLISEYLTNLVNPKFIPAIALDEIFTDDIQELAQKDLLGALCSFLWDTKVCATYFNNKALTRILYDTIK